MYCNLRPPDVAQVVLGCFVFSVERGICPIAEYTDTLTDANLITAALKFCFKTCVAMKFVDDDDETGFYRAACNAAAVWRGDFCLSVCLSVCPSHAWIVAKR